MQTEETFRGIVGFLVVHMRRADEVVILVAVGRKGHTAMEEDLQIGPHLVNILFAGDFKHAMDHGHHPGRYTRKVRHVLRHGDFSDAVALFLEIGEQGDTLGRNTH